MYKTFPRSELIKDWSKLIKLSREEVVQIYEQWKEIEKENKELNTKLFNEKTEKISEIAKFLKANGIDPYKYKLRSFFTEKNGFKAWFQKNIADEISQKYPYYRNSIPTAHGSQQEVDGVTLFNNQSPTTIVELYDKIIFQYRNQIEKVKKNNILLVKSIEYATTNNIDIENLNPDEIISVVREIAKQEYLKEEVPVGTEIYLKHECDECDTYIMGEHRCSCGNRRINIVVEGNLIDGFYEYPEAY